METILIDSSILIENYRLKDKSQSTLFKLVSNYILETSAIVQYEVYRGDTKKDGYWDVLFSRIPVLAFDSECAKIASNIYEKLKTTGQILDTADILIGASAIRYNLKLATLNIKHFQRIDNLILI